jgi:hypothetical protein
MTPTEPITASPTVRATIEDAGSNAPYLAPLGGVEQPRVPLDCLSDVVAPHVTVLVSLTF